ncbi:MAG: hypothetical protein KAV00_14220, partial [Phycisphaerae bacterium]|nr:hypothetical protein [Phycisphaerae bacterium]
MSKIEPDEILRRAEELGRVQPGPESTARAVQRVHRALEADQRANRSRRMRSKIMKIAIPSGIAAAILFAVGLWLTVQTSQPVSAAEQLKEVVKVNTAYKGWIHVTLETVNSPKSASSSAKIPRSGVTHINTADNTIIQVVDFVGGERAVMYASVSRREIIYYSSRTNEIEIRSIDSYAARKMSDAALNQTTAKGILDGISEGEREKFNVKKSKDGRYERFDVIPLGETGFKSAVLLIDPKSKLVHKLTVVGGMNRDDLDIILKYTYGKPAIKDIYSVGVPRDAKVIDNRPVQVVLHRLVEKVEKGFGNHVAVMTRSRVLPGGKLDTDRGRLRIFARNGAKWTSYRYRVGTPPVLPKGWARPNVEEFFSPPVLPKGWPRPNVKEVLKQTHNATAIHYFIMDGRKIWADDIYHSKSKSYQRVKFPGSWRANQTVAGQIWPGPGVKTKLISDKKRPKQIGLRRKMFLQNPKEPKGVGQRQETILWLDPARDDLPVEKTWRIYGRDSKKVATEVRTTFLEFARLPNGQWYP